MADPKYADLPGIDISEKDFYECGDLPEDDQNWNPQELQSESVQHTTIDTQASFNKFNSKQISGDNVDFSDKIKSSNQVGYEVGIAGQGNFETPLEKLNRLKQEVAELHSSISDTSKSENPNVQGETLANLLSEVNNLKSQLSSGNVEEKVSQVQGLYNTYSKLNSVIKTIETSAASKNATTKKDTNGSYNLLLRPEVAQQNYSSKLSQIEQRLARIEQIVGNDDEQVGILTAGTKNKSLKEAIDNLETKLNLLDPDKLPQVDTRLQAVLNKLNDINKSRKASDVDTTAADKKTEELYVAVQKWSSISNVLPGMIDRLEALNDIHKQASQFSTTLKDMDGVQKEVMSLLSNTKSIEAELQNSFKLNAKTIQDNVSALENRIQALMK